MATRTNTRGRCATTGSSQPKRRAVLIIEDDAEFRGLSVALLEKGELETIECEAPQLLREWSPPPGLRLLIVTQIQLGSSRTDSLVRILHAQPRSRLKPEVRKRKTPSRALRSASHSWPYACADGPRPPVPPLLGGRSFTIGPFYAKPELLIGFAAAVACTIALRFMLQAT
jgi:hypothetical protein